MKLVNMCYRSNASTLNSAYTEKHSHNAVMEHVPLAVAK